MAIEKPDGTQQVLPIEERAFEVVSVVSELAQREEPFGLEKPVREEAGGAGFAVGLAAGLALAALGVAAVLFVRRTRARRADRTGAEPPKPTVSLWEWTERELAEAVAALEADPRQAASAGAHLLRVYMARRFGSETEAATTEELERKTPALAERTLWPDFVRILHSFDDERFRPHAVALDAEAARSSSGSGRIRSALEDSRRLVEASRPRESGGSRR